MQYKDKFWVYIFIGLSLANLSAEWLGSKTLIYATKPLLMTVLSIFYFLNTRASTVLTKFVLLGFILSIFGDTFLMFVENDASQQIFFLLGLGSFLLTHIFYAIGFIKYESKESGFVEKNKWIILLFIAYLVGNTLFLWTDIPPDLRIAVPVYSTAIMTMMAACLNLKGKMQDAFFVQLFIGVTLFVISDSIIGLNKFKAHQISLPYPRLMIMVPYLLSQLLIALSTIKITNFDKNK